MALITCLKCGGTGTCIKHIETTTASLVAPQGDITTKKWYRCPNCHGAGSLPEYQRAEVWQRVANEGIMLGPEFRGPGDLGYEEVPQ